MSIEMMSMLTAKVQQFSVAPGGIPTLTSDEMAYCLGHISPEASSYSRLKYCNEPRGEEVALGMRRQVATWKSLEHWRIPRKEWILDMCKLGLVEMLDNRICPTCQGRKEALINHRVIKCEGCNGTGKVNIQNLDRIDLMKTSKDVWEDWITRYKRILAIIDIYEGELWSEVAKMRL